MKKEKFFLKDTLFNPQKVEMIARVITEICRMPKIFWVKQKVESVTDAIYELEIPTEFSGR